MGEPKSKEKQLMGEPKSKEKQVRQHEPKAIGTQGAVEAPWRGRESEDDPGGAGREEKILAVAQMGNKDGQQEIQRQKRTMEEEEMRRQYQGTIQAHERTIKQHVGTIKQHVGTIKKHEENIEKHEGTIKEHEWTIKKHEGTIQEKEEERRTQYEQTIQNRILCTCSFLFVVVVIFVVIFSAQQASSSRIKQLRLKQSQQIGNAASVADRQQEQVMEERRLRMMEEQKSKEKESRYEEKVQELQAQLRQYEQGHQELKAQLRQDGEAEKQMDRHRKAEIQRMIQEHDLQEHREEKKKLLQNTLLWSVVFVVVIGIAFLRR